MSNLKKIIENRIGTIIGLVFFVAIGSFTYKLGVSADKDIVTRDYKVVEFILMVVSICLGLFLHVVIHEVGHLLGGLISGYKFVSFRIFNIVFIKENCKFKIKNFYIPGTVGQCIMLPPEPVEGKYPYKIYNLGGGLMNFLAGGIFTVLFIVLRDSMPFAAAVFIPLIGIGMLGVVYNLLPLRINGLTNDGFNTILLGKSAEARRSLRIAILVNESAAAGVRVKDMPAEWFYVPDDFNDPLSVVPALNLFARLMDKHDFDDAKKLAEKILAGGDKILEFHKNELRRELLFLEIIGDRRQEEIVRLYTTELKKHMKASEALLHTHRLMYAYEKLINRDDNAAKKTLKKFNRTSLGAVDIESEREVIEIIDNISNSLEQSSNSALIVDM